MLTPDPNGPPTGHRFTTIWNEQTFTVEVDKLLVADEHAAIDAAQRAVDWLGDNLLALTDRCAGELFSLYNDEWAEGDETRDDEASSPMDSDRFRRRLTARSLMVMADGSARVVFDDDGMFSDHAVVVETDADRTPVEVFLEG